MKIKLKNNKEASLSINYKNLFKFQREYQFSKDLVEVVSKKQAVDYESVMQIIYVGYMGGNNEMPLLDYNQFLDELDFDFNRDMKIFKDLIGNINNEKN